MKKIIATLAISSFIFSVSVQAAEFWRTGTIKRILSGKKYGGCMVLLSTSIGNGCPSTGWISLDCDAKFLQADTAERHFASALIAASTGKNVSILINNQQKQSGYCVASRVDVIFPE